MCPAIAVVAFDSSRGLKGKKGVVHEMARGNRNIVWTMIGGNGGKLI